MEVVELHVKKALRHFEGVPTILEGWVADQQYVGVRIADDSQEETWHGDHFLFVPAPCTELDLSEVVAMGIVCGEHLMGPCYTDGNVGELVACIELDDVYNKDWVPSPGIMLRRTNTGLEAL